jgi:hypothetical protein
LDRDVLDAIDLIGDRITHDPGVGLLLPEKLAGLGVERPEIPIARAAELQLTLNQSFFSPTIVLHRLSFAGM